VTGSAAIVWTFVRRPDGRSWARGAAIAALVSDRAGASATADGATTGSSLAAAVTDEAGGAGIETSAAPAGSVETLEATELADGSVLDHGGIAAGAPSASAARRWTGRPTSEACDVRASIARTGAATRPLGASGVTS